MKHLILFLLCYFTLAAEKLAVLNNQEAVMNVEAVKIEFQKFEQQEEIKKLKALNNQYQKEYQKLIESFRKDRKVYESLINSRDKRKENVRIDELETTIPEYSAKIIKLQNLQIQANNTYRAKCEEFYQKVLKLMEKDIERILMEIIKQNKITMLVQKEGVLHVIPSRDITPLLTKELNKIYSK